MCGICVGGNQTTQKVTCHDVINSRLSPMWLNDERAPVGRPALLLLVLLQVYKLNQCRHDYSTIY